MQTSTPECYMNTKERIRPDHPIPVNEVPRLGQIRRSVIIPVLRIFIMRGDLIYKILHGIVIHDGFQDSQARDHDGYHHGGLEV